MNRSLTCAAALLLACTSASADTAHGFAEFDIPGPRAIDAHALYPTDDTGPTMHFGGNKVWMPIKVQPGAAIAGDKLPLVLLSHGMYGNRFNQNWLAERLVQAGYMVVALNHPGTSTFNRDPDESRQLWQRPADLGRAIDAVLADPDWGKAIDPDAVFAIGHSLGGFTVLAAAGARFDIDEMASFCADDATAIACDAFDALGITAADRDALAADMTEPRLRAVIPLDPGGTFGFTRSSLAGLDVPVLLIAAGRTPEILDASHESDRVAQVASNSVTYMPMPEAGHFDFLGLCTPNALEVLKSYAPDDLYVCEAGRDHRAAMHQQTATAILDFLAQHRP